MREEDCPGDGGAAGCRRHHRRPLQLLLLHFVAWRHLEKNENERETEGPHDCTNSNTNTAATTATQISVVKWLIMITTDNLMAALI